MSVTRTSGWSFSRAPAAGWSRCSSASTTSSRFSGAVTRRRCPSELFARQCVVSFDPDEAALAFTVEHLGAERVLWASDYPHPDAKIPGVVKELLDALAPLPAKPSESWPAAAPAPFTASKNDHIRGRGDANPDPQGYTHTATLTLFHRVTPTHEGAAAPTPTALAAGSLRSEERRLDVDTCWSASSTSSPRLGWPKPSGIAHSTRSRQHGLVRRLKNIVSFPTRWRRSQTGKNTADPSESSVSSRFVPRRLVTLALVLSLVAFGVTLYSSKFNGDASNALTASAKHHSAVGRSHQDSIGTGTDSGTKSATSSVASSTTTTTTSTTRAVPAPTATTSGRSTSHAPASTTTATSTTANSDDREILDDDDQNVDDRDVDSERVKRPGIRDQHPGAGHTDASDAGCVVGQHQEHRDHVGQDWR